MKTLLTGQIFHQNQVCAPHPTAGAVSGTFAALLPPGGAAWGGEINPGQALPSLPATDPHLEGHQGCLSNPPSDADHRGHQNLSSTWLPSAGARPMASCHPALCLREALPGAHQSPKNLVGASALPNGKFWRVRKVFARIYKIT